METNDLNDLWKSEVNANVKTYSDTELKEMVVKSARQSLKPFRPGKPIRVMAIAVMLYLIYKLLFVESASSMKVLDFSGLIILFLSYARWEYYAYKLNKHRCDMPVKEWLEWRIKEVEKTIHCYAKYGWLIYTGAGLIGFSFYVIAQLLVHAPFRPTVFFAILAGFIIFLFFLSWMNKRNYAKSLQELKELYKQLEE